jgi:hypothetical protein
MGYAGRSVQTFSSGFSMALRGAGTGACAEAMRKGRIVHGASLPIFLIFCKKLLALTMLAVGRGNAELGKDLRRQKKASWLGLSRPSTQPQDADLQLTLLEPNCCLSGPLVTFDSNNPGQHTTALILSF